MHVRQLPRTRALVQVVYVLGHQQKLSGNPLFKRRQRRMRRVRNGGQRRPAALVVKAPNQRRVALKPLISGDILHPMVLPQPVAGAKSPQSGFRRNSRPGQDDNSAPNRFFAHNFPSGMRASVCPNKIDFAFSVTVEPVLTSFPRA